MQSISITGNNPSLPWIAITDSSDSIWSKADSLTGELLPSSGNSIFFRSYNVANNGKILLPCNRQIVRMNDASRHVREVECETCKREVYNIYQALFKNDKIPPYIKLDIA